MEGFTVSNANRFLETGKLVDNYSSNSIGSKSNSVTGASETSKSFADVLSDAVGSVNNLQKTSDKAMQNLATGRTDNVAEVMIAAEQADIALKLMVQVRNKIIDAYQEVMKMQV